MKSLRGNEPLDDLTQTSVRTRPPGCHLFDQSIALSPCSPSVEVTEFKQGNQMIGMETFPAFRVEANAGAPAAVTGYDQATPACAGYNKFNELLLIHANRPNDQDRTMADYIELQAPIPSDPHYRRRAFQLIALLYGAAALANVWWWLR
jgi:hypothetical protein